MTLYRAQSLRRLEPGKKSGHFRNPSLDRDRKPRDLYVPTHLICDSWFESKFGIRYRSGSLIGTGSIDVARGYLTPSKALIKFRPASSYHVCFSRNCKDLFGTLQFRLKDEVDRRNEDFIHQILEDLCYESHPNQDLTIAAATGGEAMVFADDFLYQVVE